MFPVDTKSNPFLHSKKRFSSYPWGHWVWAGSRPSWIGLSSAWFEGGTANNEVQKSLDNGNKKEKIQATMEPHQGRPRPVMALRPPTTQPTGDTKEEIEKGHQWNTSECTEEDLVFVVALLQSVLGNEISAFHIRLQFVKLGKRGVVLVWESWKGSINGRIEGGSRSSNLDSVLRTRDDP